jgi:cation diffusion facilitator CzcD-associated flavoprotein CzcO
MTAVLPVAIIGAGPYGLSIGAHLHVKRLGFRIFGSPMESWKHNMPEGMHLKSEGFASDLYDPSGQLTLSRYAAARGIPYAPLGTPVTLDTIVSYGQAFQRLLVPELEEKRVVAVASADEGFTLSLDDGETFTCRSVISAVGTPLFSYIPPALLDLPGHLVSHSADHSDLTRFKGRAVTVVGGGSSAMDLTVLLQAAGADVRMVTRRHRLKILARPERGRSVWQRLRWPISGLGHGWKFMACEHVPWGLRMLPRRSRMAITRGFLGPAAGWSIADLLEQCPIHFGHTLVAAREEAGRLRLDFQNAAGGAVSWHADHLICATGYYPDVSRLTLLSPSIRDRLRRAGASPELSQSFESSVPGLYFSGLMAANSFGPVMRFMLGARYTARRIALSVAR